MKPIKLTMTAFGPYAQETTVEFDKLDQGIYLITGDTGAGKTTIFDAIVFALYGEASGSSRRSEMFHSDFVPKSQDTKVTLDFLHNGRSYTVERTLHYTKNRASNTYSPKPQPSLVVLKEEGKQPVEKAENVTARVTELIGLDAEQFRKIVMLAQGEFRAFLEAGNDARAEILGKLYNNRKHQLFAAHLRAAEKKLRDTRAELVSRVHYAVSPDSLRLKQDLDDAQRSLYDENHPALEENLQALTDNDRVLLVDLNAVKMERAAAADALKARLSVAEMQNGALDRLSAAQERHAQIEQMLPVQEERRRQAERAARALHIVRPEKQRLDEAVAQKEDVGARLENMTHKCEQLGAECVRLQEAHAEAQSEQPRIDSLKMEIDRISKAVGEYDQLEAARREAALLRALLKNAQADRDEAAKAAKTAQEEIASLDGQIAPLEGVGEKAVRLNAQVDKMRRHYEDLRRLARSVKYVAEQEKTLRAALDDYAARSEDVKQADRIFHALNDAFISGQAAVLAKDLSERIQRDGEAFCPVCRTHFTAARPPVFAGRAHETPDKAQVDAAAERREKANEALNDVRARCSSLRAQIENEREGAVRFAQELALGFSGWEELSAEGRLRAIMENAAAEGKRAAEEQNEANAQTQLLEKLKKRRAGAQEAAEKSALRKEQADAKIADAAQRSAAADAALSEREGRMEYPSKEKALERVRKCEQEKNALEQKLDRAAQELDRAQKTLHGLQGEMKTLSAQLQATCENIEKQKKQLDHALNEADFANLNEYEDALRPVSGDGEKWLQAEQEALQRFERDRAAIAAELERLGQETKDFTRTDMARLEASLSEAALALRKAEDEHASAGSLLANHENVLANVRAAKARLHTTDGAYARLAKLADLAAGRMGDGGVYSFDKFALGEFFREILQAANEHLSVMSGGQYELVHQEKGERRNGAAGLNIEVRDSFTGEQRKTGSLSGGESFQVSMALALGLSGTVQAHAGGQRVDAMFIDEGFGSLDDNVLDKAIGVLDRLAGDSRQIGIISHVAKLEECIPQKIVVKGSPKGSSLRIVN